MRDIRRCCLVSLIFCSGIFLCSTQKYGSFSKRNLLELESCGVSMADRIIGGKNASLGQFPWLARIGYTALGSYKPPLFRCGGSLISKMYVVTAAHCVTSLPQVFVVSAVRLGENNAAMKIDCEDGVCAEPVQDFFPAKIIVHRQYNKPQYANDIALIRLHRPAFFNGWVEPICLPFGAKLSNHYAGTQAEVAGWGVYDSDIQKGSDFMLYVPLPVVDLRRCVSAFAKSATITNSQLCVGGVIGEDSCGGDSGGPLMKAESVDGLPPRYFIIGIVSFGSKHCGKTTMPAVYTRMSWFLDWLLDNVEP